MIELCIVHHAVVMHSLEESNLDADTYIKIFNPLCFFKGSLHVVSQVVREASD